MQRLRTTIRGLAAVGRALTEDPKARVLVVCEDDRATYHYAREFFAENEALFERVDMTQYAATARSGGFVQFMAFSTDPRRFTGPQWSDGLLLVSSKTLSILEAVENINLGLRLGAGPKLYTAVTDN